MCALWTAGDGTSGVGLQRLSALAFNSRVRHPDLAGFCNIEWMRNPVRLALIAFLMATATSVPAQNKAQSMIPGTSKAQECGPVVEGTLKCSRFGFTYKAPFGWVDRTDEMRAESNSAQQPDSQSAPASLGNSETLLAMFERPPGAPGESINSAVVIAAESLTDYHGVKQASDYFGPISELAEQRGFKVVNEPYAFSAGAKQLVRGDFSKERGKLTMWQSSLVMIEKGQIVSFTFAAGSEDEIDTLISKLSFSARAQAHR
jgi:hypothetical protein